MKRIVFLAGLLPICAGLFAQSLKQGQDHYFYERYNSSETFFHEELKKDPSNAEAWYWLVQSYVVQNELKKAKDSLALAPASLQDEPWYMVASGTVMLNENNKEGANEAFTRAIDKTKKKNPDILAAVAEAHIVSPNGDANYAIEMLDLAKKRDKKNAKLFVATGNAYRKMYNGSEAYKAYYEAIGKSDNTPEAFYQLGKIFETQKNPSMYLDYYNKAIEADKAFAPAYYAMYEHYLYIDPAKAMDYFNQYVANADAKPNDKYSYTDLLYLTKKYDDAITNAKELITRDGEDVKPRIYKLIAYSYQDMKDSAMASNYMLQYFQKENDTNYVVKDFETMAGLYLASDQKDSAMSFYEKAAGISKDSAELYGYYKTLANIAKSMKDYAKEAQWLGKYYMGNDYVSNVDLFNWGLASYRASDYLAADSVFGKYADKYPEQGHGYYWRARSNAAIDTAMTEGLAVPHYQKLIEVLKDDPTDSEKKWIVQAYGYLAAYETNTEKDYAEAITYFEELLKMDPENKDAKEYIAMLEKRLDAKNESSEANSSTN